MYVNTVKMVPYCVFNLESSHFFYFYAVHTSFTTWYEVMLISHILSFFGLCDRGRIKSQNLSSVMDTYCLKLDNGINGNYVESVTEQFTISEQIL